MVFSRSPCVAVDSLNLPLDGVFLISLSPEVHQYSARLYHFLTVWCFCVPVVFLRSCVVFLCGFPVFQYAVPVILCGVPVFLWGVPAFLSTCIPLCCVYFSFVCIQMYLILRSHSYCQCTLAMILLLPSELLGLLLRMLLQTLLRHLFCCPATVAVVVFFILFRRFLFQAGKSSSNHMVAVCIFL